MLKSALQSAIIAAARPYISRELPGWGNVYRAAVSPGALWTDAKTITSRDKVHGYLMHLNLSEWPDRSAYFLRRWHDLATQLCMAKYIRSGDTVIDVGANRGMFALAASKLVGLTGRVLSFEPNPDCIAILNREIATNSITNIHVCRFALGSTNEELLLSVPIGSHDQGTLSGKFDGHPDVCQVKSAIKVGDEVLADQTPDFIKIDVEGFEFNVVSGMRRTIERSRAPILTEVNPQFLEACGSSSSKLFALMNELGYDGHRIDLQKRRLRLTPVTDDGSYCDVIWLTRQARN